MGMYRKKSVVIEAFCWTGDHDQVEDPEWIVDAIRMGDVFFVTDAGVCVMKIKTPGVLGLQHQVNGSFGTRTKFIPARRIFSSRLTMQSRSGIRCLDLDLVGINRCH
jgi:hypothetical protein